MSEERRPSNGSTAAWKTLGYITPYVLAVLGWAYSLGVHGAQIDHHAEQIAKLELALVALTTEQVQQGKDIASIKTSVDRLVRLMDDGGAGGSARRGGAGGGQ